MSWTLRDLIKASGNAGTSGQSFRNHVTGAASGAAMSQYKVTAWLLDSGPSQSPIGGRYDGQQTFDIVITFTQGSRAFNIKRTGAGKLVFNPEVANNGGVSGGYDGTMTASQIDGAATGSATIVITPPFNTDDGASCAGSARYQDYDAAHPPPDNAGGLTVIFASNLTVFGGTSVTTYLRFSFSYVPDIGPFNPTLTWQYLTIPFGTRPHTISDFDYEWHVSSTYTDSSPITGNAFTITSYPSQDNTYYLRYRQKGTTSWANFGAVAWHDSRLI